jgi:hypothetical protein
LGDGEAVRGAGDVEVAALDRRDELGVKATPRSRKRAESIVTAR